jgi:hypothetical protein
MALLLQTPAKIDKLMAIGSSLGWVWSFIVAHDGLPTQDWWVDMPSTLSEGIEEQAYRIVQSPLGAM